MKKLSILLTIQLVTISLVTGCGTSGPLANTPTTANVDNTGITVAIDNPTQAPFIFNTATPGSISIHGILAVMNPLTALPDPNDPIYLVPFPADRENLVTIPPIDVHAIQAQVNEATGEFVITNIKPGQYAIVVKEMSGIEVPVRFLDIDNMVILTLEGADINQIKELGYLRFP